MPRRVPLHARACKTRGMPPGLPPDLSDITRKFACGEVSLLDWRDAAHRERFDRQLSEKVLSLIAQFENSMWTRNDLRSRARELVPAERPAARRRPAESIYEAGLRGQRRRG